MKVIVLILIILGCSICGIAQNKLQSKNFGNFDFMEGWQKADTNFFSISPKFKSWSLDNQNDVLRRENNFLGKNNQVNHFNMPVVKPKYYSNMPVLVPDSTLNYAIKEKRFNFFNPLEGNENSEFKIVKRK